MNSSRRRTRAGLDVKRTPVRGWLEGYLLTGRHGLFNSYEAFIRIVDSMFSQHAKWPEVTLELPWRPEDRVAELSARLARLQQITRVHPSGPGFPRPCHQQEGRHCSGLFAAGCELSAVTCLIIAAQPALRQRGGSRQHPSRNG